MSGISEDRRLSESTGPTISQILMPSSTLSTLQTPREWLKPARSSSPFWAKNNCQAALSSSSPTSKISCRPWSPLKYPIIYSDFVTAEYGTNPNPYLDHHRLFSQNPRRPRGRTHLACRKCQKMNDVFESRIITLLINILSAFRLLTFLKSTFSSNYYFLQSPISI